MDREEAERLADRKEELYRQLISGKLEEVTVDGLQDFLECLADEGLPMAVATSGPIENVDMVFDGLGIRSRFKAVVTGDEVRKGKPHPEAFLTAAAMLNVLPSECAVFEDSVSGIQAALSASAIGPDSPSIVVISFLTTCLAFTMHEATALPSTCTVHAPHWAMPQLYFVPVSPR